MLMLAQFYSFKLIILYVYIISVACTQFRGKVRLKFLRQIVNHSTLMAPINLLMYLFSVVPNKPFINQQQFPELQKIRENWQMISEEAKRLVEQGYIKASENNDDLGFNSFFKRGWKRFYLKWYQDFLPSAQMLCPNTVSILKTIPNIHGAMFTLLPKQGQLKPHRDPYAGSLRYHLGLVTPNSEKCFIEVDGIRYAWKDGEDILFDETFIHSAKNDTDMDRIILFCDIERPLKNKLMTMMNRFFGKYVLSESATKNLDTDHVGIFNKFYKYHHYFSLYCQRIKKANKFIYQCIQYLFFGSIIYLLFFI